MLALAILTASVLAEDDVPLISTWDAAERSLGEPISALTLTVTLRLAVPFVTAKIPPKIDPGATAAPPVTPGAAPVVITADQQAWIQVKDGDALLKEGVLEPGQSFEVPPTATAPVLTTAKAEALRISVGTATAPQVGPAATRVSNVSLLGPALLKGPVTQSAAPAGQPAAPAATLPVERSPARPAPRLKVRSPDPAPPPAANAVEPAPPAQ